MKSCRNHNETAGFTLVETLVVVAVIAVLAGGSLMIVSGSARAAKEQKLSQDVLTLNSAVSTFLANGGSLVGLTTAEEVVERIKTRAVDAQADQVVGLRSGLLDLRVTPVRQSAAEASTSEPRVLFHLAKNRFFLAHGGEIGIKAFVFDEQRSAATEDDYERRTSVEYSSKGNDKWVWEYTDHPIAANVAPNNLPPWSSNPSSYSGTGGPTPLPLDPPVPSMPGDVYSLFDYEGLEITLSNPNPPGASEVFYSTDPGVWERYSGPISILPGTDLETQVVSLAPEAWSDSPVSVDEYRTTPVILDISIAATNPSYDYVSLGGALEPGTYPPPTLVRPGLVTLNDASSIPEVFLNSGVFNIRWTLDGSDPRTAGSPSIGDSFSGGFPGQEIPIALDDWGPGDTLELKAYAKSEDSGIVTDSALVVEALPATKIQLREPLIDIDPPTGEGTLRLQNDYGDTPLGAWIYFTTDGSDPGIAADGGPITGTLYSGPIPDAHMVELSARVYAPVIYSQWFLPSEISTEVPGSPPPVIAFTMTVSTTAP